jgi:hypothetical protein
MAYVVNFTMHLEIAGVPLSTPAWEHTNLQAVLGAASVRGENVVMPGAVGVRPVRRRPTETVHTVELTVFGDRDWENTAQPDPVMGLIRNLEHLKTNVVDPLATTNSVRTAVLVLPVGTRTAAVQVLGFEVVEHLSPACVNASMDVAFLRGQFV